MQRVSAGNYQVTITDPACAHGSNAPVVSVSDSNPPAGQSAGAFPVAWYGSDRAPTNSSPCSPGVVAAGSFTATDHTFDVQDTCQ